MFISEAVLICYFPRPVGKSNWPLFMHLSSPRVCGFLRHGEWYREVWRCYIGGQQTGSVLQRYLTCLSQHLKLWTISCQPGKGISCGNLNFWPFLKIRRSASQGPPCSVPPISWNKAGALRSASLIYISYQVGWRHWSKPWGSESKGFGVDLGFNSNVPICCGSCYLRQVSLRIWVDSSPKRF